MLVVYEVFVNRVGYRSDIVISFVHYINNNIVHYNSFWNLATFIILGFKEYLGFIFNYFRMLCHSLWGRAEFSKYIERQVKVLLHKVIVLTEIALYAGIVKAYVISQDGLIFMNLVFSHQTLNWNKQIFRIFVNIKFLCTILLFCINFSEETERICEWTLVLIKRLL